MLDHLGVEDAEDISGVRSNVLAFKARHSNLDRPGQPDAAVPAKNTFSDLISTNIILEQTAAILQTARGDTCKETTHR
jgi:hypothetical protein